MNPDRYTKFLLSIIASCLLVLVLERLSVASPAYARESMTCEGELKANAFGGAEAMVGGYKVEITCR